MRHRIAIAIAVAVALSSTAAAQRVAPPTPTFGASSGGSRSVSAQSRSIPPPPPQAPSPGANVPPAPPSSAPIGIAQLPPPTGGGIAPLLSPSGTRDVFRAGRRTYAPRYDRSRVLDPFGYLTGGYAMGGFYPGAEYQAPDGALRRDVPVESGYLRLTVQPYSAEVYVDGYYVSTVGDFSGSGPARALEAGPHRIEIRAEGYETATFDVRIEPNEMVTYRRELARSDDPPRQARNIAPAIPKTFYVIPKCYAGDRRPSADKLPAGCRASNVRAIPPVVNRAR